MAVDSLGAKRQPQFLDSGAPDIAVDDTSVADYAAEFGNYCVGTAAERDAATSWAWEGLMWRDTNAGDVLYIFTGSAWQPLPVFRQWALVPTAGMQDSATYIASQSIASAPYPRRVTVQLTGAIASEQSSPGQILLSCSNALAVASQPSAISTTPNAATYAAAAVFLLPAGTASLVRAQTSVTTGKLSFVGTLIVNTQSEF